MSRPFDEARYAGLLEGLEATEVLLSDVTAGTETRRFDPEYFNKAALLAQQKLEGSPKLSDFVANGYRVVYETTQAIDREDGIRIGLPFFLQSSDISTPFIDAENMICVSNSDWERYPRGHIRRGELLIEVKGKAEKIAIVPDDFPEQTLVTGTCFKLTTKEPDDCFLLTAFLTCKYGQALKDRLKTNLLVSYIAKPDLYGLPVPQVSSVLRDHLKKRFDACFAAEAQAKAKLKAAETELLQALGLVGWQPPQPLSYVRSSRDSFAAGRFDAEYFHPAKKVALDLLAALPGRTVGDLFRSVRDLWNPDDSHDTQSVRNYDLTHALSPFLDDSVEPTEISTISSMKKRIQRGDLLVSRLRSYLREIAVVLGDAPLQVASTEFIVLRPRSHELKVEALLVYLRSLLPQLIFKWSQDGSNHPRFDEKELLNLHIPNVVFEMQDSLAGALTSAIKNRQRASQLLNAAKRAVEIAIETSEAAALDWLKSVEKNPKANNAKLDQ